jgi:GrpB-like predicted nucleotidyltransferase (UPF0157 family)
MKYMLWFLFFVFSLLKAELPWTIADCMQGEAYDRLVRTQKYSFKPYNACLPHLFEREKQRIAAGIDQAALIEHVGSTAVPGLGGKGIIDIMIAAREERVRYVAKQLQELGYELRERGSRPDKLFFKMALPDEEEGMRTYHLHLTSFGSEAWNEVIAFRDHLRTHPEEMEKYAELKKRAVLEAKEDGEKYRELKEPFFKQEH